MRSLFLALVRFFGRGRRLEAKLDRILATQEKIMSKLDDLVTAIDAETNAIATRIDGLKTELDAAVANNQAPSADTLDKLSVISDRLKSLGSDPAAPIPPASTDPVPTAPATELAAG